MKGGSIPNEPPPVGLPSLEMSTTPQGVIAAATDTAMKMLDFMTRPQRKDATVLCNDDIDINDPSPSPTLSVSLSQRPAYRFRVSVERSCVECPSPIGSGRPIQSKVASSGKYVGRPRGWISGLPRGLDPDIPSSISGALRNCSGRVTLGTRCIPGVASALSAGQADRTLARLPVAPRMTFAVHWAICRLSLLSRVLCLATSKSWEVVSRVDSC